MGIFLSGPFFNDEDVERIDRVKRALEGLGLEVYSTFHWNSPIDLGSREQKRKRFRLLCQEIGKSDGIFAVLDGKDAGTIWEMGYASALGKRVVAFTETEPFFSLMIDGSAICISGFDQINKMMLQYFDENYQKDFTHSTGRPSHE